MQERKISSRAIRQKIRTVEFRTNMVFKMWQSYRYQEVMYRHLNITKNHLWNDSCIEFDLFIITIELDKNETAVPDSWFAEPAKGCSPL